jgi:hypothetical protein
MIITQPIDFKVGHKSPAVPVGRIPALSKMLAMAIYYEELIKSGRIEYITDIAIMEGVTQARVSQIMSLLNLSPVIQEMILLLPRQFPPCKSYSIKKAIAIANKIDFDKQMEMFEKLL